MIPAQSFVSPRFGREGYVWSENIGWINLADAEHFAALGPGCPSGDLACDGLISLLDFSRFHDSITGPTASGDVCDLFDFDDDEDVDLVDSRAFQTSFTGN